MHSPGKNFIVMMFPRFAGGKFLANCLSLSRHVCPQEPTHAKYLMNHSDDYQYRLSAVLSTLPQDQDHMDQWITQYEFGDIQLYGEAFFKWLKSEPDSSDPLLQSLLQSRMRLFLTAHDGHRAVESLLKIWPGASVIKLINHDIFRRIAQDIKGPNDAYDMDQHTGDYFRTKYQQLKGESWPDWDDFEKAGYDIREFIDCNQNIVEEIQQFYDWRRIDSPTKTFDVDGTFFDQERFLVAMSDLYDWLQLDDFNRDMVQRFWQSYIRLHLV